MSVPERLIVSGRNCILSELGEAAVLLTFGESIDLKLNKHVLGLAASLRAKRLPGVLDHVPAYASLLVQFDPLRISSGELYERLGHSRSLPLSSENGARSHSVPVSYNGEEGRDLPGMATRLGLTEREVIRAHTSTDYRVFFIGFMPGFAYMGPVVRKIATPRLAVPRLQVPAGSVGIAGNQTGIYPFTSPGGWNIIGRTAVQLWNTLADPPALLTPGDTVRFTETDRRDFPSQRPAATEQISPRQSVLRVTASGAFTTVQDFGRPGYGWYGVPRGGALDRTSLASANRLLGNDPGAPALEILGGGLELEALRTTVIAVSGEGPEYLVDGRRVPSGLSWLVRAGSNVTFKHAKAGGVAYLALAGGFDVAKELGSSSTLIQARLGGYGGRALRAGDVLGVEEGGRAVAEAAGRRSPVPEVQGSLAEPARIRLIPFTGPQAASHAALHGFLASEWLVSEQSNRMGIRLESPTGQPLPEARGELISFGVVRGAVQLPPGGSPIILGPDHGTTGGYPILGVVPQADWPALARLGPAARVRFEAVSSSQAIREIPF